MHPPVLLSYAFRPFFLLGASWAVIAVAAWLALMNGLVWPGAPVNWVLWHIHEMVFGFIGAAITGFLLTAIATWTGRPPVQGIVLGALITAWIAGRIVSAISGVLPIWIVVPLELSFPLALTCLVARELASAGNRRNYVVAVLIGLFALADIGYLLSEYRVMGQVASSMLYLTPHLVVLLITLIGGRIIVAFTTNWLRARGAEKFPIARPWLDITVLLMTLAVGIADVGAPSSTLTGVLILATAAVHGVRLSGWCGRATIGEPLLFILHAGYAWIVIGYLLLGLTSFTDAIPRSSALHAITTGAAGTMILAVMTRVSLGHTGRKLRASTITVALYVAVMAAALIRVAAPMAGSYYAILLNLSAIAWMVAFAGFIWEYWSVLSRPRLSL